MSKLSFVAEKLVDTNETVVGLTRLRNDYFFSFISLGIMDLIEAFRDTSKLFFLIRNDGETSLQIYKRDGTLLFSEEVGIDIESFKKFKHGKHDYRRIRQYH